MLPSTVDFRLKKSIFFLERKCNRVASFFLKKIHKWTIEILREKVTQKINLQQVVYTNLQIFTKEINLTFSDLFAFTEIFPEKKMQQNNSKLKNIPIAQIIYQFFSINKISKKYFKQNFKRKIKVKCQNLLFFNR